MGGLCHTHTELDDYMSADRPIRYTFICDFTVWTFKKTSCTGMQTAGGRILTLTADMRANCEGSKVTASVGSS